MMLKSGGARTSDYITSSLAYQRYYRWEGVRGVGGGEGGHNPQVRLRWSLATVWHHTHQCCLLASQGL